MRRYRLLIVPLLWVGLLTPVPAGSAAAVGGSASTAGLVRVAKVGNLGSILVTAKGFALYEWRKEKRRQIRCTGACATAWPPLLLPPHTSLARHIRGAGGTFGVILRPDGKRQLTYQGKALYTYQGDTKPGEALCQAVEGWYVFRAH